MQESATDGWVVNSETGPLLVVASWQAAENGVRLDRSFK